MTQPSATMTPPNATISRGPLRGPMASTIQPSTGVSQVSSAIKILNASWISAIDQPCALLIGLTNRVQPYCRLAISTMQAMPTTSWVQRVVEDAIASDLIDVDEIVIFSPLGVSFFLRVSLSDISNRVGRFHLIAM